MRFTSAEQVRGFLRICIDPGTGRDKRTPTRLVEALPATHDVLKEFAPPYLGAFARTAADLNARAEEMRHAYAAALLAWIRDEEPSDRLVDLATTATAHARDCSWCTANGVLSHRCADGRRLAAALLAPVEDAPVEASAGGGETSCAHESWDVTSEYRDGVTDEWVQGRRCNDCRERLDDVRSAEPHFDDSAATAAAAVAGHATVAETATAYATAAPGDEQTDDEEQSALPPALPWLGKLRGDELHELITELRLALGAEQSPRPEDETSEQRGRRSIADIERVLSLWRDAFEYQRPPTYLTRDGRVWTHQDEHQAKEGPALYESPTSPKAYTVAELRDMYGWVAAIEGETPADGVMSTTFEDYARTCRAQSLVPHTTVLVESGMGVEVYAAVHVSLDPHTELSPSAVDAIRTAVCDGLAFRED